MAEIDIGPKVLGHCVLSGKLVYDIAEKLPSDSIFPNYPRRLGKAHDDAYRVNLILSGGTVMPVTVCEEMLSEVPKRLALMWKKILRGNVAELDLKEYIDGKLIPPDIRTRLEAGVMELAKQVPLGILYTEKCSELGRLM